MPSRTEADRATDLVRDPGGTFRMGSDVHYPEEGPAREVEVSEADILHGAALSAGS